MRNSAISKLGFWSAILSAFFSAGFMLAAIADFLKMLNPPWNTILPILPSLLLAPSFLIMLICLNQSLPDSKKVWSQIGVSFATLYMAFISIVYITWLLVVLPHEMKGKASEVALLRFTPGSMMQAIDGLGYFFMGIATLFTAQVFSGTGIEKRLKWLFTLNGLLAMPIIIAYITNLPFFTIIGTLWGLTVPGLAVLMVGYFKMKRAK